MGKLYEYLDEADFFISSHEDRLGGLNLERMRIVCMSMLLIYCVSTPLAYMTLKGFQLNAIYLFPPIMLAVIWRITCGLEKSGKNDFKKVRIFTACSHAVMAATVAGMEYAVRKDQASILFAMALIVFSAFYVDYLYLLVIFRTLCVVGYLIGDWLLKEEGIFKADRVYLLTALFISIVSSFLTLSIQTEAGRDNRVLKEKSCTDPLTGLLNKAAFENEVKEYLLRKGAEKCALLIFDFDNFKKVNDNYGHQVGDEVLKSFAFLLHENFRETDSVGRVGGDEFMVLVRDVKNDGDSEKLCNRILFEMRRMQVGKAGGFSASIGIAETSEKAADFGELYRKSDRALYQAKENGKACCVKYKDKNSE